ncbi:MAG: hypothetical protein U9N60_03445 [Thermodesulfobacteriota bacterium]|nr:hypothetical protein [Thermodesulfobacteriota bacterium]
MGLNAIESYPNRKFWEKFINKTHVELRKANLGEIVFDEFKNNGSYAKAKTGNTATKWVFAEDLSRRWVELELKPRTSKGVRQPQNKLYTCIKKIAKTNNLDSFNITWDEEDRDSGNRGSGGGDIRIKIYLNDLDDSKWISKMVQFIKSFKPILGSC